MASAVLKPFEERYFSHHFFLLNPSMASAVLKQLKINHL